MPFNVGDHQWANERFAGHTLRARNRFSLTAPAGNHLRVGNRHYVGTQFLGRFEDGMDGWQTVGAAITNHSQHEFYQDQLPIFGHVGPGFLTSYHPVEGDELTGKARSPAFTAANDHHLAVLVGGGTRSSVGVRLLAAGREIVVWSGPGERLFRSEHFILIIHPLAGVAGRLLQLELFDGDPAGHIMLDHVLLVREVGTGAAGNRPAGVALDHATRAGHPTSATIGRRSGLRRRHRHSSRRRVDTVSEYCHSGDWSERPQDTLRSHRRRHGASRTNVGPQIHRVYRRQSAGHRKWSSLKG